jgi:TonB family protein
VTARPNPTIKNENQPASGAPQPTSSRTTSNAGATKNAGVRNATGNRVRGEVAQQVLPDVSRSALRTVHGKLKVRVKVTVDSSGNVLAAKFDSRGPSNYFADRTLQAARRWTFTPPQVDGQGVASEWILRFEFDRAGTKVHPEQTSP